MTDPVEGRSKGYFKPHLRHALVIPSSEMVELVSEYCFAEGILYLEHDEITDYCIEEAIWHGSWEFAGHEFRSRKHDEHYQNLKAKLDPIALSLLNEGLEFRESNMVVKYLRKADSIYLIFL